MRVVAHGSPRVLEEDLLDRVSAAKAADPLASVLIVVPSRRLADHVARRLLARFGALVGVSVLQHQALGERILMETGAGVAPVLDEALLTTLFTRVLREAPAGPLRDFARIRPGAASALLGRTMKNLREAGIDPAVAREALPRSDGEIASLYARWSEALDELARSGAAHDDTAMARVAAERAAGFGARFATILHHGAYDLIGVRIDLLAALDRGCEVTFLLPADPDDDSGAFGVDRIGMIARGAAWTRLPARAPSASVDGLHAQGAHAELQAAVYEALAAVASGSPPEEVAVIVRSFAPYAVAVDALVDAEPSWHTSFTRPLRRDPAVGAALRAIAATGDRGTRTFGSHADDFEAHARSVTASDALAPLLASMRGVETMLGEGRSIPFDEALAWLEERVDASTAPPASADGGGVRILDAMQARGLTFDHIGLAGMNSGIFPRVAHEDPFLRDASRRRLRDVAGRPLPIAGESDGEERLLLAQLRHQASGRLAVSWRRADETGRPLVPSLALRAIDADLLTSARALPAHPLSKLEAWSREPGVISPRDETLLVALASETGAAVAVRRPDLAAGIALVAETESFAPSTGRFDGRIGAPFGPKTMAATALARLGLCPLKFFFRDVLKIVAPHAPPTPFSDDPRVVGDRVHDALRHLFTRLIEERAFEGEHLPARVARARALLGDAWTESVREHPPERGLGLPGLDAIEETIWLRTLDAFLVGDLAAMAEEGLVPDALEQQVEMPIPGGPPGLIVHARLDRVLRGKHGPVVGDYKTGGELGDRVNVGAMLSGEELQVAIYALLTGAPVELLGVGPRHDGERARFEEFKTAAQRDGVLETIRSAAALSEAGRYPIHSGEHCRHCDYRPACRRGHPPTEFREELAPDVTDLRDCWSKSAKHPTLASVRASETP